MTKTKIIQQLREMLRIAEQDEDDFFEEYKKKHPDMEWDCAFVHSMKLGLIESKIEFLLMFLEMDVKEETEHEKGKQREREQKAHL